MGYSAVKRTLSTIVGIAFQVECEYCSEQFAFERLTRLEVTESHFSGSPGAVALGSDSRLAEVQLKEKVAIHVGFSKELAPTHISVVRCPKCGYVQSWMVESAKHERANKISLVLTLSLFSTGLIVLFSQNLALVQFVAWFIALFVGGIVINLVVNYLVRRFWNREPNQGRVASTEKRPVLRMKIIKPEKGKPDVDTNKIDVRTFEQDYQELVL